MKYVSFILPKTKWTFLANLIHWKQASILLTYSRRLFHAYFQTYKKVEVIYSKHLYT